MGISLHPYPEYKDSGIPWLGAVPVDWAVLPNRSLFKENITRGFVEEQMLSVTISRGVIQQRVLLESSSKKDSSNENKANYKLVEPGDIAYNKMRAWQGAIGESKFRGIVSPAYIVVRLRESNHNPSYFHYLYRTPAFAKEAERWSYGIVSDQWSLRAGDFKRIYSLVPSSSEQLQIAKFIESVERMINRYLRAKRRQIELLNEQKQRIIQQAVTRGLNPDVRLKPSGVEWLGEAPEHWQIIQLKHLGRVQTGVTLGKGYNNIELVERPYLRVANVQDGYLDLSIIKTIRLPESEARSAELQSGDILMTEGGDIDKLGRGCIWQGEIPGCVHQNHVFAVRVNKGRLLPEYLSLLMTSNHGRSYFQLTAKKTTNLASTNSSTIYAFPIILPPIDEQMGILSYVTSKTSNLSQAVSNIKDSVKLLNEYRTRLISDVVTGKLDVRGLDLSSLADGVLEDALAPDELGGDGLDEDGGEEEPLEDPGDEDNGYE